MTMMMFIIVRGAAADDGTDGGTGSGRDPCRLFHKDAIEDGAPDGRSYAGSASLMAR